MKKFRKVISQKQLGFSLIEMIVALGVGGFMTYAVMSMMRNTTKQAQSLTGKTDFVQFTNELSAVFNNADHCKAAFAVTNTTTKVPPLDTLGEIGDPHTVPVPVAINFGNSNPAKGALGVPYKAGSKWGNSLTILKFEFAGKSRIINDVNKVRPEWTIPLHIVVSRRSGIKIETSTKTSTGTGTGTGTDTGTDTSTSTETAVGVTQDIAGFTKSAGSENSIGGDILEKTFNLTVATDSAGKAIVGCFGQTQDFWTSASTVTKTSTATGTGTATVVNSTLDIVYNGGSVVVWGDMSYIADPSITTDTRIATSIKTAARVAVGEKMLAQAYVYRSDARLKTNVREIPDALDRISQLHGVEYDWKESEGRPQAKDQIGLLAQEVEKIFPEAVSIDPATGMKSVAYESLIPPMIEAMKARQKLLVQQQREIDELRTTLRAKK